MTSHLTRIFHDLAVAHGRFGPAALTIGSFDGVHLGHQQLVRAANQRAAQLGLSSGVVTFDPHPRTVVGDGQAVPLLISVEERVAILADHLSGGSESGGVSHILVLPFDTALSHLTPEDFVRQILVEALDTRVVVVGDNFRFGHKQAGTPQLLTALGAAYGFETQFLPHVCYRGETVSSSVIRGHLRRGEVSRAGRLLGRCYAVEGEVIGGQGIGSRQTVPTLNLAARPELLLAHGVYVTEVKDLDDHRVWPAVTNIGTRPTFDGGDSVTIESYLLASFEEPAPRRIRVEFHRRIRDERKFPDATALRSQILLDVSRAKAYWRRLHALKTGAQSK
jgi:riboflavin kinase/FMN adenylyltransferase